MVDWEVVPVAVDGDKVGDMYLKSCKAAGKIKGGRRD